MGTILRDRQMHNHPYLSELDWALEAVRIGTHLARRIQSERGQERRMKGDRSPVTVADFAVQASLARSLMESFPADPLVAEEDSGLLSDRATLDTVSEALRLQWPEAKPERVLEWIERGGAEPSERFWTLDPVDGTKGFLRGEQFVVALALIEHGQVVLGVVGCPNLNVDAMPELGGPGSLALAVHGQGAWIQPLNGGERRKLRVSDTGDPRAARLLRSVEASHTNLDRMQQIQTRLEVSAEPVRMDSQAKYVMLAAGKAELIFRLLSPDQPDYRERIWDQAAGSLLVEEAGGRVTDLEGRPLDFSAGRLLDRNRGVLASNAHLHKMALQALRETVSSA